MHQLVTVGSCLAFFSLSQRLSPLPRLEPRPLLLPLDELPCSVHSGIANLSFVPQQSRQSGPSVLSSKSHCPCEWRQMGKPPRRSGNSCRRIHRYQRLRDRTEACLQNPASCLCSSAMVIQRGGHSFLTDLAGDTTQALFLVIGPIVNEKREIPRRLRYGQALLRILDRRPAALCRQSCRKSFARFPPILLLCPEPNTLVCLSLCVLEAHLLYQRSTSPITISMLPRITTTSAMFCPKQNILEYRQVNQTRRSHAIPVRVRLSHH